MNDAQFSDNGLADHSGVVTLASPDNGELSEFTSAFAAAIAQHRHFDRHVDPVLA